MLARATTNPSGPRFARPAPAARVTPLPQLGDKPFLTDGGLETTLVFHQRIDLPCFAAYPLVASEQGRARLLDYIEPYLDIAAAAGSGFVLSAPTWRANADWGARLGHDPDDLRALNISAIEMLQRIRTTRATGATPMVVEGVIGPRGDGYRADDRMGADEAAAYHGEQIAAFRDAGADMVGAYTLTYPEEAVGIVRAAHAAALPVAVSFTVETDGLLPSGVSLGQAIRHVDRETDGAAAYFMINCAHPAHFESALASGAPWMDRVRGLRANASTMSHAELDGSSELDSGDPADLGRRYRALRDRFPQFTVLGGCCGTDHRHVAAICEACLGPGPA